MKTYNFVLILDNVDENTDNLEDILFDAGCDDALINFREGTVFLDFSREASTLEEAIKSAVHDVESAAIDLRVKNVAPEDLVTETEIARRARCNRQSISQWIKKERRSANPFPGPVMKLQEKSPLWSWIEVVQWLYAHNIVDDEEQMQNATILKIFSLALEERNNNEIKVKMHKLVRDLQA